MAPKRPALAALHPSAPFDRRDFYTYIHTRNDTGAVFYVGKGYGVRAHATGRNNPHWRHITAKHGRTVHTAMTNLTEQEALEHEKFLILCFKDMGVPLTNCTNGGDGISGYHHTDDARSRISISSTGRVVSPATRQKIADAVAQQWKDPTSREKKIAGLANPEVRAKINKAITGHVVSPATRARLSAANTGYAHSTEARAKMSASAKLRPHHKHTEEAKARMREAIKDRPGRVQSEETKAKIRASTKGRPGIPLTAEAKAKISASQKIRLAKRKAVVP